MVALVPLFMMLTAPILEVTAMPFNPPVMRPFKLVTVKVPVRVF